MSGTSTSTVVAPNGTTSTQNADGSSTLAAPAAAPADQMLANQQALLVTSNASRAATADNTAKLNAITSSLAPATTGATPATQTGQGGTTSGGTTIHINSPSMGGLQAGSNASNAGKVGYDAFGNPVADGGASVQKFRQAQGTYQGTDGNQYYNYDSSPVSAPSSSVSASGGSTTNATDTSGSTSASDNDSAVAGISDPGIKAQVKASLDALDTQKQQAQQAIDDAKATLANDPAAAAAIDSIKIKMDQQIQLMKDKNAQVLGRANTSVAAFGGLGIMSQNFLSDEQDRATQRISSLVAQEQDLVLKATIAYQTKDLKALNDAMTAYNKVNTDKLKEINSLLSETNKVVTQGQAQQRIDATATKNAISADISKSTNLGISLAKAIADSGVTDPKDIDAYIQSAAEEYGITNPEILKNAITKAQGTAEKDALTAKNTNDTIQNRDVRTGIAAANAGNKSATAKGGGTDGSYKYTADDITAYKNLLNTGGTSPDGTKFNGRGKDTYVDPGAYVAAYTDWKDNGGTPAGFLKKFPVSSVNPASYGVLPAELQPKTKASAISAYKTTP